MPPDRGETRTRHDASPRPLSASVSEQDVALTMASATPLWTISHAARSAAAREQAGGLPAERGERSAVDVLEDAPDAPTGERERDADVDRVIACVDAHM